MENGKQGEMMPPKTKGKQVNIFFPDGLFEEMSKVMDKANKWMNVQEFVRDAVKEKVDKFYKDHAVG